jgi:hypothetical protein
MPQQEMNQVFQPETLLAFLHCAQSEQCIGTSIEKRSRVALIIVHTHTEATFLIPILSKVVK